MRTFLLSNQRIVGLAIAVVAIGIIILALGMPWGPQQDSVVADETLLAEDTGGLVEETVVATAPAAATPETATVVVYISGAVQRPNVYSLAAQARVIDVVTAAGGLTTEADTKHINLAEHIHDAEHIHVPLLGEAAQTEAATSASSSDAGSDGLVNINTASAEELDALPSIGEAYAQKIIDYRDANGPFASIDDLNNVKGISPTLIEKIASRVTVGP